MKHTNISLEQHLITLKHDDSIKYYYRGSSIDRPLAIVLIVLLFPIFLLNALLGFVSKGSVFTPLYKTDALGRTLVLKTFTAGVFLNTAILFDVFSGKIGFCGIPLTHSMSPEIQLLALKQLKVKAGIFSLYDLHVNTGLTVTSKARLLEQQLNGTFTNHLSLIIKSTLCRILYGQPKSINKPKNLTLFGLTIKNTSMKDAVNWITNNNTNGHAEKCKTQLGFFVNVHSINLSISDNQFFNQLSSADALFADGSGMRLAATKAGFTLNGNNNGTDMLPHLCRKSIKSNQSLFFLGAKPGVAEKAANKLTRKYSGLRIVGTEHGYSDLTDEQIIEKINNSGCDVLLVAMGSPIQEKWLLEHKDQLQCKTALAVGGLFDFYSGNISRSPLWLREVGMEWVWRLMQEPRNKFNRYVIGTPLFLYRTFFLGLANTGVK